MRYGLTLLILSLVIAQFALAAPPPATVPQGGTGWNAIQAGAIPYGGTTLRLATTTQGTGGYVLAWVNGVPAWVATTTFSGGLVYAAGNVTANCATITGSADLCDGNDASGGGGVWPFTPSTNYGVAVQATTTPLWFQNGLMASTTSHFVNASTTLLSIGSLTSGRVPHVSTGGMLVDSSRFTLQTSGTDHDLFIGPQDYSAAVAQLYAHPSGNGESSLYLQDNDGTGSITINAADGSTYYLAVDASTGERLDLGDNANGANIRARAATGNTFGSLRFTALNTSDKVFDFPNVTGTVGVGVATTSGNLAYWGAGGGLYAVATTSATCSGSVSCTGFTVLGASPITITGSGGDSSSKWATSTILTSVIHPNVVTSGVAIGTSSPSTLTMLTIAATTTDATYPKYLSLLDATRKEVFYIGEDGYTYQSGTTPYYDLYESDTAKFGGMYMSGSNLRLYTDTGRIVFENGITITGQTINGALIPDSGDAYDLGSNTLPWAGLFLGPDECLSFANPGTENCMIAGSYPELDLLLQNQFAGASGRVAIGTTTPQNAALTIATSTRPQIMLSSGAGSNMWAQRAMNGNFYLATSTVTGTSTIPAFMIDSTGRVGIATSSPTSLLQIFSTATTTLSVDSNHASRGTCLELKDRDGVGYTYVTANNGVLTASTVSCK